MEEDGGFRSVLKKTEEGLAAVLARHELREKDLAEREAALVHKERALEAARRIPMKETASINIGGTIFTFGRDTLEKHKDTVLGILLLERDVPFVDRDPELFRQYIAHFIRHGVRRRAEDELVRKEFDFWCIPDETESRDFCFVQTPNGTLSNGGRTITANDCRSQWKCYTYTQCPLVDGDVFTISLPNMTRCVLGLCVLPINLAKPSLEDEEKIRKQHIPLISKKYRFQYNRGIGLKNTETDTICIHDVITNDPVHLYIGMNYGGDSVSISKE